MSTTTFKQLQDDVLRFVALTNDSDTREAVKRYLNEAARDVWTAYPWPERRADAFVNTVAPYETGTVSVTNGSTTVTGSGTTFTSGMVGRKFALGYSQPWYEISAFTDTTHVTLDRAYVEDSASAQNYVIYDDVLNLGSMDALLAGEVTCFDDGYDVPLTRMPQSRFLDGGILPMSADHPTAFRLVEDSNEATRIQVTPVPDDTYAIHYAYLKRYRDMSGDGDTCDVPEVRIDVVRTGATAKAFRLNEEYQKAIVEEQRFFALLEKAIQKERRMFPTSSCLRAFDSRARRRWVAYRYES